MIAKNAFWPLSSGPGRRQHRATERAEEDRRPADLERVVGEADEVALPAEGLDPGVLGSAEIEEVVGLGVLGRHGIEDAADERRFVVGSVMVGAPCRPELAREPDHLGAHGLVFALGAGQDPFRGQFVGAHRVAHLRRRKGRGRGGPRRRSPGGRRPAGGLRSGRSPSRAVAAAWVSRGVSASTAGSVCTRGLGGGDGVVDQLADPGQLLQRRLGLEPSDRPAARVRRASPRPPRTRSGSVSIRAGGRRQAIGQRSELASEQREEAVAGQVDPPQRVPGLLAEVGVAELRRLELADEQVAIDGLVGW